ncbi:DUF4468 domain-containing protein [Parabacteroides bouchesdurhonensis]|uniref:DUF4468 domain-containing protein n=1 Tax=Parabacteroides bouchesdurhonensis TaxID=1936995 RepID=UPI0022E1E2A2|nr:DUF4468 domain-containing protein [Parabacteroides bouchesdurhonensis]
MKRLLLLLLFIPALLAAQNDQRYLAGAVPEIDGKVVFSKEFNAPSLSQDQIYDVLLNWAQGYFNNEDERVVYANKEKGEIAALGNTYIIFQSNAISLDRALMSYQFTAECEGSACTLKISAIRYTYDVAYQREPEKYTAEGFITDKYAINKKGKLIRSASKFRKATIDFVDKTMNSALTAFDSPQKTSSVVISDQNTTVAPVQPAAPVTPVPPVTPATPVQPVQTLEGFVAINPAQIPSTILQMLPDSPIVIEIEALKENNATWQGISTVFCKKVASFSIAPASTVYQAIGDGEVYKISILNKENNNTWMIIQCRKQGETDNNGQKTVLGEIMNVWIK